MKKDKEIIPPEQEFNIFDVDELLLDKEWVLHPKQYFKYAIMLDEARNAERRTEQHLEEVEAELSLKIRSNPDKYKLPGTTEGCIKAAILSQPEYKEILRKYNKKKDRTSTLNSVINSLDKKTKALENIVKLHGQNYFSIPKTPEGMGQTVDEMKMRGIRRKK